jgi:hypothetical protein
MAPSTPYSGTNQLNVSTDLQCVIMNPARDDSTWAQRGIPQTNGTYVSGVLVGLLEAVGLYTQTDLDNGRCGASGQEVTGQMYAKALQYVQVSLKHVFGEYLDHLFITASFLHSRLMLMKTAIWAEHTASGGRQCKICIIWGSVVSVYVCRTLINLSSPNLYVSVFRGL